MKAGVRGLSMALVVACLAVASTVHASLLDGQTVATTNFHGTAPDTTVIIGPVDSVVGPGVELTDFGVSGFVTIDFSDTNILITLNIDQPSGFLEILRFVDSKGMIPDFTGVTINPATNYEGFGASRLSFNADRIDVNLTALRGLKGQQISLDLTPGPVLPPADHFLCYKVNPTKGSAKFVPLVVSLADQFDTASRDFNVKKPRSLCTPANKNGEGIVDISTHLERYEIALTKQPPQAKDVKHAVRVTNQFGELLLDTGLSDRLLVPTAKSLTGPASPPGPNNVDHFKCYKVKASKGAPKFVPIGGVQVSDQFTDRESQSPKRFDLKKPTRLCNPVNKNGEGIKDPNNHLLCYRAVPTKGQPEHLPIKGLINLNNQFGSEQVDTVKEEDLCVPSLKQDLGHLAVVSGAVVSGEEETDDEEEEVD